MQEIRLFARLKSPSPCPLPRFLVIYSFLGLAIGASLSFHWGGGYASLIALTGLLFLLFSFRKGKKFLLAYLSGVLIGSLLLLALSFPARGVGTYGGLVIDSKENYFILWTIKGRYYIYEYGHDYQLGDIVSFYGNAVEYSATEYESRFSFAEYLCKRGISSRIYVYEASKIFAFPLRFKDIRENFLSAFSPLASGAIESILFDRKDYSNDLISLASSSGTLYFLSASGLLFQAMLSLLTRLLSLRLSEKKSRKIVFVFAICLLPFFHRKIGVWRVILTRGLSLFLEWRNYERWPRGDLVALVGILMILLDPYMVIQESFLIGFGLSILISFSGGTLRRFAGRKKTLATSFLVIFFLFPIFSEGNAFHLLAPVYSLIYKPLTLPFFLLSLLSFIIHVPFVSLLNSYASFLFGFTEFMTVFDLLVPIGNFNGYAVYFHYFFMMAMLYFLEIGFPYPAYLLNRAFFISVLLRIYPVTTFFTSSVSFINVGQGDATLIVNGMSAVMIDTGGNIKFDMAKEVLMPYLRGKGVYRLDALIITHDDYDHSGAAESLVDSYWVKDVIREPESFPLTIGDMTFYNLNIYGDDYSEENDKSLVLSLNFMNKDWLFMGDASVAIEKKIMEDNDSLDCDILKVGHHGSSTSSSADFLDYVSPSEAVISVGANNSYGHPTAAVLSRLKSRGIKIRRTDEEGTIEYSSFRSIFA